MGLVQVIEVRLRGDENTIYLFKFRKIYSIQAYFDRVCPGSWSSDVTKENVKDILDILKVTLSKILSSRKISLDGYYVDGILDSENGFVSYGKVREFKRLYRAFLDLYESFNNYEDVFYLGT